MKKAIIFIFFICISFNFFADQIFIGERFNCLDRMDENIGFYLFYETDASVLEFSSTDNSSGSSYSFYFPLDYADALRKGIEKYEAWKVIAKENSAFVNKEIPNSSYSVKVYWHSSIGSTRSSQTSVYLEALINPDSGSLSLVIKGALYNSRYLGDLYFTFLDEDEIQRFYNVLSPDNINSKAMEHYEYKQRMQTMDALFQ